MPKQVHRRSRDNAEPSNQNYKYVYFIVSLFYTSNPSVTQHHQLESKDEKCVQLVCIKNRYIFVLQLIRNFIFQLEQCPNWEIEDSIEMRPLLPVKVEKTKHDLKNKIKEMKSLVK
jgi:hypothetical protein